MWKRSIIIRHQCLVSKQSKSKNNTGWIECEMMKNENKIHATIHFGLKGSTLTVKKVEGLNNQDEMVVLYKDL